MDQVPTFSHFMSFTREFQHEFYAHPDISSYFYADQDKVNSNKTMTVSGPLDLEEWNGGKNQDSDPSPDQESGIIQLHY